MDADGRRGEGSSMNWPERWSIVHHSVEGDEIVKAQRLICTDVRRIELEDFELPRVPGNGILVQNDYTAVSVGTEIYNYAHGVNRRVREHFHGQRDIAIRVW